MAGAVGDLLARKRWLAIAGVALVLVAGAVIALTALTSGGSPSSAVDQETATSTSTAAATATRPASTNTASPTASPTPIRFAGILDGVAMSEEEWNARKDLLPLAVMVDNSIGGFPQAGLDRADLVYEAFVEGGITRFMAVYWRNEAETVVPVRSARTPFVIWADELKALYAHAGGAITENDADAIGQISRWGIRTLNAFLPASSGAYSRTTDRAGPFNLATSTGKLRAAAAAIGYTGPPPLEPWLFKADGEATSTLPRAGGIEVNFRERRLPSDIIQWRWDAATNAYLRFQFGGPHLDSETGKQLSFRTVIVMRVPYSVVDDSLHVVLDQIGQGKAQVFLDGKVVEATWRKLDREGRTRFYDAQGAEIALNRGPIFIEVVGPVSLITVAETPDGLPVLPPYTPPPPAAPQADDEEPLATPIPPAGTPTPAPTPEEATPAPTSTTNTPPAETAEPQPDDEDGDQGG